MFRTHGGDKNLTDLETYPKLGLEFHLLFERKWKSVVLDHWSCCEYFLKKIIVISSHEPIDLGLREFSQSLALSFREKGKNFNLIEFMALARLWKVATTSSNSLMCT